MGVIEMKYYLPIPLLGNLLYTSQWFLLMDKTFTKRYAGWITYAAEMVVFSMHICLGSFLPYMTLIRSIYVPILFSAAFLLLYQGRWQKIIFATAGLWTTQYITEIICFLLLYTPEMLEKRLDGVEALEQIRLYFYVNVISAAQVWLLYLLINRGKNRLTMKQWALCAVFLFSQEGILFNYLRILALNPTLNNTVYLIVLMFTCVILNAFLVQYVLSTSQRERLRAENQMLAAQIDGQLKHYNAIAEQYEMLRQIRHDVSKHLETMERMLRNGNTVQAEKYITHLKEDFHAVPMSLCQNLVVDALLHNYQERAEDKNIDITFQTQIPNDLGVDNADLVCTFGNLLDNAFEACEGHQTPKIFLSCAVLKNYLVISIRNTIGTSAKKQAHSYGTERGIGTRILNHIAAKYNGRYETDTDGISFSAYMCLENKEG